jgi:hypothetical protein
MTQCQCYIVPYPQTFKCMIWCLDEGVIKNLGDRAGALSILHKMYSVVAVYDSMWQFYITYGIVMIRTRIF